MVKWLTPSDGDDRVHDRTIGSQNCGPESRKGNAANSCLVNFVPKTAGTEIPKRLLAQPKWPLARAAQIGGLDSDAGLIAA